jgi:hypothetical protein
MWKLHQLIWKNYVPQSLEKGMWYINKENQFYKLESVPRNQEEYIQENGYPIELMISDDTDKIVVHLFSDIPQEGEIAWWDEGDHTDEFRDITIKDINKLYEDVDGYVSVLMDDETGEIIYEEDKPILTFPRPEHINEYEEDEDEEEQYDEDEDDGMCPHCSGTGMGMWDGSSCNVCGGWGYDRKKPEYDPD